MLDLPKENSTTFDEFVVSVSPKGQITLPKAIRELFGVEPKDKVVIRLERGEVKVTLVKATLETIYQSVPALKKKLTDKEMAHIAWEDHVLEALCSRESLLSRGARTPCTASRAKVAACCDVRSDCCCAFLINPVNANRARF